MRNVPLDPLHALVKLNHIRLQNPAYALFREQIRHTFSSDCLVTVAWQPAGKNILITFTAQLVTSAVCLYGLQVL